MTFPDSRSGKELKIKKRKVDFSFWPMGKDERNGEPNSTLFVSDPWHVIEQRVRQLDSEEIDSEEIERLLTTTENPNLHTLLKLQDEIKKAEEKADIKQEALDCLRQSKDFYKAIEHADTQAAKALLLYYCFMNLAKCYITFKTEQPLPKRLYHGLSIKGNGKKIKITKGLKNNVFKRFSQSLLNQKKIYNKQIDRKQFLSQILVGHRAYCQSQGEKFKERFISIKEIHFRQDEKNKQIWLLAQIVRHDFDRIGKRIISFGKNLSHGKFNWENVNVENVENVNVENTEFGKGFAFAQTEKPFPYEEGKLSDALNNLCQKASRRLWCSVTSYPPYRKYYIYMQYRSEKLMPQLLSIYLATFYFGSIARYKPSEFHDLLNGEMSPFIYEFFEKQPAQFLYLMASEFMEQEVARPAVV